MLGQQGPLDSFDSSKQPYVMLSVLESSSDSSSKLVIMLQTTILYLRNLYYSKGGGKNVPV